LLISGIIFGRVTLIYRRHRGDITVRDTEYIQRTTEEYLKSRTFWSRCTQNKDLEIAIVFINEVTGTFPKRNTES
jgi:hypothetical protein